MTSGQIYSANVGQLKELLDSGEDILVVDVRTKDEFVGPLGHIAGAKHIELAELQRRIDELHDYNDRYIALVCRTDRRSAAAAEHLRQAGFQKLVVVMGGMEQWNRDGLPVER